MAKTKHALPDEEELIFKRQHCRGHIVYDDVIALLEKKLFKATHADDCVVEHLSRKSTYCEVGSFYVPMQELECFSERVEGSPMGWFAR